MQFLVGKLDESRFAVPHGYAGRSRGYERASLIDRGIGSVHMGVGVARLAAGGAVDACVHANEKGIYVFDGELEIKRGGVTFRLGPDDYALIPTGTPHAFRNTGNTGGKPARWFDMQAPQPKPPGKWQDTFFVADDAPWTARAPALSECSPGQAGHFVPRAPIINPNAGVSGLRVFRFMEKEFGAQCFYMMRGELSPGGVRGYHDHPVEESYLALSGEAIMSIEGEDVHLKAGDYVWTGVGACHAFRHVGSEPFRWIETQAPQFPAHQGTRNYNVWDKFNQGKS
jgi:mannose-6-phosphate isomerase-like protein (cupin superfamily)